MWKQLIFRPALLGTLLLTTTLFAMAQQGRVEAQIRQLEGRLPAILESNNVAALDSILHPAFTVQTAGKALIPKARLLEAFRSGNNPYSKFRPVADTVVLVNDHTAITSGKEVFAHKSGEHSGEDQTRFYYHVWVRDENGWRLAGRVVAGVPDK